MIENLTPNPFPSGKGNQSGLASEPEKKIVDSEPPKIYIPACGVLCDVFWWARRDPPTEQPASIPAKTKDETP
jgi:hypothetical protein